MLTITEQLRKHGVVGKFVEFYGEGVAAVPLANRATIGNMSPEFGSTAAMFPIDDVTLDYLRLTGRSDENVALVEAYAKEQGLWHDPSREIKFSEYLELDLSTVVPSISGPKRPQDRIILTESKAQFREDLRNYVKEDLAGRQPGRSDRRELPGVRLAVVHRLGDAPHGAGAARARSEVQRTSDQDGGRQDRRRPRVRAGPRRGVDRLDHLLHQHVQPVRDAGRRAAGPQRRGQGPHLASRGSRPPWRPGSKVVTDYYNKSGLTPYLEKLGFYIVGYGCATCIGNSGPLDAEISEAIQANDLSVTAVLSGNRNFEGRINPDVKMNYLASPPLVIAYALAGTMDFDFENDALGQDEAGNDVFLKDIWPNPVEVQQVIDSSIDKGMFARGYEGVFEGDDRWKALDTPAGDTFAWDEKSTYVRKPPYFEGMKAQPEPVQDITGARVLLKLGDSVTTDHISPAGSFKSDTPAGQYLLANGVERKDFNSYGSRRGNHEVMIRGTFANIRHQEPAPRRRRGRLHPRLHPGRRPAGLRLRRRAELPGRRHPAGRPGRQGVRLRLVPRLGRQGHRAAGRQGRHRRELRAHPPLQPDRHGRPAAAVPGRPERRQPGPDRHGNLRG